MGNVREWLNSLGFGRYSDAFEKNAVEWDTLPELNHDLLKDIGVEAVGHRVAILKAIREGAAAAPPAAAGEHPTPSGEAERRQLTVLFCDLAGSTELSRSHDPEDLRSVMRAYEQTCQSAIEGFGGQVARFMGDGVLAYFGYPVSHEDDAERAVHAGLAIQEGISGVDTSSIGRDPLRARVGIATGSVVVGDIIGDGSSREYAAVGETPNVAARLQAAAEPGEVLVAPLTRTLARAAFDFVPLGPRTLKGLDEPMQVYRVRAEQTFGSRFDAIHGDALPPLAGRDEELELLERRWRGAKSGRGQLVLVSGDPGIGKSHLVGALRERICHEPHLRLQYQCSAHQVDTAFHPVTRVLRHACQISGADTSAERHLKVETVLLPGIAEPRDATLIAELLGDSGAQMPIAAQDPQQRRSMTLAALVRQLEAQAEVQPVLCIFEDMHWADPSTRDLVELMVERIVELPVLLLLTARPQFQHAWGGLAHTLIITMGRLTAGAAASIVNRVAGQNVIAPALMDTVLLRGDGVPLYLEEIARTVADASKHASSPAAAAVPATLRDSLMARLDNLGAAKTIAQVGAVLGREFNRDAVLRICGMSPEDVDSALAALSSAGIVQRQHICGDAFVFKHALIQEAAYDSLLRRRRRELHAAAAADLRAIPEIATGQPELVARHLMAAQDDEALGWWDAAALRAVQRGEIEESVAHLRHAIEVLQIRQDRDASLELECDLRLRIADAMRILDHRTEAFQILAELEPLAATHGLAAVLARLHSMRGNLYFPLGETQACEREHTLALSFARSAGDQMLEANALGGLGDAWYMRGHWRTASEYFEDCVRLARKAGLSALEATYLPMCSAVLLYDLELDKAVERAMAAIECAEREGLVRAQMMAYSLYAQTIYETGKLEEARRAYARALELARALGARRFESIYLEGLARVDLAGGGAERAVGFAREAVAIARATGMRFLGPRCLGALALMTSDGTECEAALAEGEALLAAGCVAHNHIHFYRDCMTIRLKEGRYADVLRYADALEAHFEAEPISWSTFYPRWGRALAAAGSADSRVESKAALERLREEAVNRRLFPPLALLDAALV